jgi:hypothetical protein
MGILWFAIGSLVPFIAASALSVFAAGQVAPGWGQASSFQLLCLLSVVASVMLLVGFGIAALAKRRLPRRNRALLLGVSGACVFMALVWIAFAAETDPAQSWLLVFTLPLLGAAAACLQRKDAS